MPERLISLSKRKTFNLANSAGAHKKGIAMKGSKDRKKICRKNDLGEKKLLKIWNFCVGCGQF
jgi:hypothetical protein